MAEFDRGDAYIDQIQSNVLISYSNPLYLARQLFPLLPVNLMSGILPQLVQSHWFRNQAGARAVGTRSNRGAFAMDNTMQYVCKWASFGVELPDLVRDNQVEPYNLDQACTEFATDKILMEQELNFTSAAFTTGKWGTDYTGVASAPSASQFIYFGDYAASTPLVTLSTYNDVIEGRIGREGNKLVMGKQVWTALKWHPDLLDNIKYTQRAQMTPELLASMLEIDQVLIGRGIYTTSAEGTSEASVSYSRIWGKHMLLLYGVNAPTIMAPAGGYTVAWQRRVSPLGYVRRFRDDERELDVFEASSFYTHKVTTSRAGVFLSGAVA
jgi:hypothetical protein